MPRLHWPKLFGTDEERPTSTRIVILDTHLLSQQQRRLSHWYTKCDLRTQQLELLYDPRDILPSHYCLPESTLFSTKTTTLSLYLHVFSFLLRTLDK